MEHSYSVFKIKIFVKLYGFLCLLVKSLYSIYNLVSFAMFALKRGNEKWTQSINLYLL